MANGTISLTRNAGGVYLDGQILWNSTSNGTQANTSTVTAQLQLKRTALNTTTGTFKGTFTVGGTSKTINWYGSLPSNTWVTVVTVTVTVSHNISGAGSCYLYAKVNGPVGTTMEGTYVSGAQTVTLDTIPRYASVVSASNFTDEEDPIITYTNPTGESVELLQACISLTGAKDDIPYRDISKTGSSYTFALTENERNVLRAATPNSNYLDVVFCIRSSIGGILQTHSAVGRMTITNGSPTLSPAITDSNTATYNLTGNRSKLVRYWSNAAVTIGASAVKGASLKSQKVTCGDQSLTGNGTISGVESNSFVFTAADSRGNTATKTLTPSFVEYIKLTCDLENTIPDASGTMTVGVSGNYYNGSFGARNNTLKVYYRYKQAAGSFGSWQTMPAQLSGHSYSAEAEVTGLDYRSAYVFEAYAADALATVYAAPKTMKAIPVFDWSEQDFQFHVPVYDQTGALLGNSDAGWQNPPMMLGVEYRTTERYNGKPVYSKLVNFGALPNATEKIVAHNISNINRMVYVEATAWTSNSSSTITLTGLGYLRDFKASEKNLYVQTNTDMTGWTNCVFHLKYTKSTD